MKWLENCCIHRFPFMMDVREMCNLRGLVTFGRFLFKVLGWQMAFQ